MNTPNESNIQTGLSSVLEKITEIVNASDDGDYIYRGEPECYGKVSSNLYREYEDDIEAEYFDIKVVQNEILKEAREYTTHKMDDLEILTELQHHGGKTNLIDFTTDYLVALFFACNKKPHKPGRVILVQGQSEAYKVEKPPKTIARAGVQKSIFVQSPSGVVSPEIVVCIPADLKGAMLDYLRKHHDISTQTIYNDLQGFIENRSSHRSAYTEFYKGVTCQQHAASARDRAEKQQWYDKAVVHYTAAIDLNPEFTEAYTNRGVAYGNKGEFDRAIQDYDTAIDLNPQNAESYNNRGITYADKDKFDRAIQDYDTAIDLNPELADAYTNRGNAYGKIGELDTAIQDYDTAIALNPELADVYTNRGNTYHRKGELDTAIRDYDTAIDLNPEYVSAYNNRGTVYSSKGEFDTAIHSHTKAIELNPEHVNAYNNRGTAYHSKGEFDTAIQDYDTAIALNPEYANAYSNRGIAYYSKGEFDTAIQDYDTAIALNPELVEIYYTNRGNAYYSKGEFDTAIQDYNTAIALNPELADPYGSRGEVWLHLREWEKAKVDLITAKNMGVDLVASFHNEYESIEDFETKHGVEVPEDIVALLRRD